MWDQNVSKRSKILQNHHSTASTTPECRIRLTGGLSLHTFRLVSALKWTAFFFFLTPSFRDKVSESCFTGQLPFGMRTSDSDSTTPDPAQGYATGRIVEISRAPRVCLSNHAVGTSVLVHQSDSKATLAWPTGSEANSQHASQIASCGAQPGVSKISYRPLFQISDKHRRKRSSLARQSTSLSLLRTPCKFLATTCRVMDCIFWRTSFVGTGSKPGLGRKSCMQMQSCVWRTSSVGLRTSVEPSHRPAFL